MKFSKKLLIDGLTAAEMQMLSTYNSERHRGIMHTPEWQERMEILQRKFNEAAMTDRGQQ